MSITTHAKAAIASVQASGYVLYIGRFSPYGAVLGLFFLLMTWAFLVAEALVIGAELNAALRPATAERRPAPTLVEITTERARR